MKIRKTSITSVTSASDSELLARIAKLEDDVRRLTAESSEREAERDEYVNLYEIDPVPALTLDAAYAIRRVNHAAAHLLGDAPVSLFNRSFRGLIAPRDRAVFPAAIARASSGSKVEKFRVQLELPLLPAFPIHVWMRYSRSRGLFELRLLDLREQERAEAETRRLAESERAARDASAAKDKFIAVLSHELRAPLTPVLAAASALRAKPLPAPIREAFEMIERNIAAEARLIDDLLDVNRIVRNKMQVECRICDVHEIAQDALATLQADREAKSLDLEVELGARHHYANVDPLRLRQVFINLLKNAIKFTPEGGHVRVLSWNNGENLALEVEDDGIGIETEAMERLFEPFMEERNTSAAGGLGLGLAISKGLIELQRGNLSAHSRGPGRGSRFVVEVPTVTTRPVAVPKVVRPKSEPPSSMDTPPCVLLVDDHEDTIEILCELLTENGFAVETANSVQAAQHVDLEHVDVIVSDIGLPDGNGFDLMRELRTKTNRPAIALTGFGMESDVKASEEAGFDLHLTKPIDIDQLLTAIEGLSSKARRARSGETSSHEQSAAAHPHP